MAEKKSKEKYGSSKSSSQYTIKGTLTSHIDFLFCYSLISVVFYALHECGFFEREQPLSDGVLDSSKQAGCSLIRICMIDFVQAYMFYWFFPTIR